MSDGEDLDSLVSEVHLSPMGRFWGLGDFSSIPSCSPTLCLPRRPASGVGPMAAPASHTTVPTGPGLLRGGEHSL